MTADVAARAGRPALTLINLHRRDERAQRSRGGMLAAGLLIPAARELFGFGPLHGDDAAAALFAGLAALLLLDVMKRAIGPPQRMPHS